MICHIYDHYSLFLYLFSSLQRRASHIWKNIIEGHEFEDSLDKFAKEFIGLYTGDRKKKNSFKNSSYSLIARCNYLKFNSWKKLYIDYQKVLKINDYIGSRNPTLNGSNKVNYKFKGLKIVESNLLLMKLSFSNMPYPISCQFLEENMFFFYLRRPNLTFSYVNRLIQMLIS